jgi:hypothetical protein
MVERRDRRWVVREVCHASGSAIGGVEDMLSWSGGCLEKSCVGYSEVSWSSPSSMLRKRLSLGNIRMAWIDKVSLVFQWHSRESRITANAGA